MSADEVSYIAENMIAVIGAAGDRETLAMWIYGGHHLSHYGRDGEWMLIEVHKQVQERLTRALRAPDIKPIRLQDGDFDKYQWFKSLKKGEF
jgi:hypothetical protein|tara:strand:- start:225 stop:500 length:276 start_codon:yes stop_codon:yes gene_type:complete